ncbi:MAG TPA: hypothetical protein VNE82_14740 [Candidatus Binataceae bacterium]|nr:hypothetical protein [Candidatus Binataceae bacterium]
MYSPSAPTSSLNLPAERPGAGTRIFFDALAAGFVLLLIAQLAVGTSVYFAAGVFVTLMIVVFTWRFLGIGNVAGLLIAVMATNYLVVSQILKTLYGQPGDSNLGAPDTTILVLLVGFSATCAAAILVTTLIGKRRVIAVDPSPTVLLYLRNITLGIGLVFVIYNRIADSGTDGSAQYGGFYAISHQFSGIIALPILAETWRLLMLSKGQRSLSVFNIALMIAIAVFGFISNTKEGTIAPFVLYLATTVAYRCYVTRGQIITAIAGAIVFVFLLYPAVQIMRSDRTATGITAETATEFVETTLSDPLAFFRRFQQFQAVIPPNDLFTQSLAYLGTYDELTGRFLLIANADVVVNAVNADGPFGIGLWTMGIEQAVPTVLYPDKPRDDTSDIVTWYYGLRDWHVVGSPAIGLFAESYAIAELPGVVFLSFILMAIFFFELELTGTTIVRNFLATFFFFNFLHAFSEQSADGIAFQILRNIPIYYAIILGAVFLADVFAGRHTGRRVRQG